MKPFQTIQLNVKVPEQTADEIKRLAISRHQSVAELLRHFIEEGLKIHSYEQNIDFIAGIIRQYPAPETNSNGIRKCQRFSQPAVFCG